MIPRLSVIIIARDEELDLPACLESLKPLGAEVILLDGGSTDGTVEVAKRGGAAVHARGFTNFAEQKQAALELASGPWALSVDADERVSPELAREIASRIEAGPVEAGFTIPFEVRFMGRALEFGGLGGERHLRLFRRELGRFAGGELHEGVEVDGAVGELEGRIVHEPYRDLDEYLAKLSRYTTLGARKRLAAGRRFTPLHHLLPLWELFNRLFVRLGILDGTPGVAWAGLSAFHSWVKHLKLRELEERR